MPKIAFWQGNMGIAMGAIAAGCRFFGGYPITPSTEIAEAMGVVQRRAYQLHRTAVEGVAVPKRA